MQNEQLPSASGALGSWHDWVHPGTVSQANASSFKWGWSGYYVTAAEK